MDKMHSAERAASLFFRFNDCMRRYKSRMSDGDKKLMVLGGLSDYEKRFGRPVTVTGIAKISGIALPNVSRLIKPFEEEGLLIRQKRGRTVSVVITPKGREALAASRCKLVGTIAHALGAFDGEEQEQFLILSEKLVNSLEKNSQINLREISDD